MAWAESYIWVTAQWEVKKERLTGCHESGSFSRRNDMPRALQHKGTWLWLLLPTTLQCFHGEVGRSVCGWISHLYTWAFSPPLPSSKQRDSILSQTVHWVSLWNTSCVEFLKGSKPYNKAMNFNESVSKVAGIRERNSGIWITMSPQGAGKYWTER